MAQGLKRTTLNNILIAVSILLIVLLTATAPKESEVALPSPPKLDISVWNTDSGSKVWFSPMFSDHVQIQLWYEAGFGFDDERKGISYLLSRALQDELQQAGITAQVHHTSDYIQVAVQLPAQPERLNAQLARLSEILYRPDLAQEKIQQYKAVTSKASDELWKQAYPEHPYAGPAQGDQTSLGLITRAELQQFQRHYLHPQRLHASIAGDLVLPAAQIIMEKLLPDSRYAAAETNLLVNQESSVIKKANVEFHRLVPALTVEEQLDLRMFAHVLGQMPGQKVRLYMGKSNASLLIQNPVYRDEAMEDWLESGIMPREKRKLGKTLFEQTSTAARLAYNLAKHNTFDHTAMAFQQSFDQLQDWDEKRFKRLTEKWLTNQ
ncbi:insulinase family protein [Bermanella marisrubri]|uniref:Insulinase-like:Peptidase M16, C-terminal n=1 Tax=Bermanella marisrubri TaxID=207949 RepID=Q1N464_9GAMM|nr:insulinase family protein [Bermanella marisrubri]EAT13001.1 Insulinase-like:Peptidase M16, C-terminal [Oceanobacter sp. RED65] [Bermanella marisrubri]QIZ82872.1 insulinase family protein [Bermanella marisrubri]